MFNEWSHVDGNVENKVQVFLLDMFLRHRRKLWRAIILTSVRLNNQRLFSNTVLYLFGKQIALRFTIQKQIRSYKYGYFYECKRRLKEIVKMENQ